MSVTLTGADGTGKTTISKLILSTVSHNSGVCLHWFRGSHLLASILARLLAGFKAFQGLCNPYYKICVPRRLRWLWVHVELWSILPHVFTRLLLKSLCNLVVCDRGLLDFVAWLIVTLDYPEALYSLYGRFLVRLASREKPIYLYASLEVLVKRADAPRDFIARQLAVYNVLAKYLTPCRIDTGYKEPVRTLRSVLECLREQTL